MWIYKSCPRCRGDIFVDADITRTYIKCLQCGYEREIVKINPVTNRRFDSKKRVAVVAAAAGTK